VALNRGNRRFVSAAVQALQPDAAAVVGSAGRIVVGVADPDAMARMPFTGHGFHLRSVPEVIDTLRGAGLGVEHRRISQAHDAPHLLIATPTPPHL
jgi:hypothetical protein